MTTIETSPRAHGLSPEDYFGDYVTGKEILDDILWVRVHIPDRYIEEGDAEVWASVNAKAALADQMLRSQLDYDHNGHLRRTRKPKNGGPPDDNDCSIEIYRHQGMREWYDDTPSARALFPLHDPLQPTLPGRDEEIDPASREFFRYSLDAQAIRARNSIVSRISATRLSDTENPVHISYGSGLAVPVFEGFAQSTPRNTIIAYLVDNDTVTSDMARIYEAEFARKASHWNVRTNYVPADIGPGLIQSDSLVDALGRGQASVVDVVGVTEYFPPALAGRLLKNAYKNLQPGGALLWGNMLDEHPQLAFNQCAIRWPNIYPRSRQQLTDIIDRTGVPRSHVTAYLSEDGVYAIFEMRADAS